MRHAIESRKRKLDFFFARAGRTGIEEEIQSDLARFGAVLICGYVEQCVAVIVIERLTRKAHPRVMSFIKSHFRRGTNYNCAAITELLERFDLDWARRFRDFCGGNAQHVAAIESAYHLRNSIAHGGDAVRGLSGVSELFLSAQTVIDAVIDATV